MSKDNRQREAVLRDERDQERLGACRDVCVRALDELLPYAGRLEHPYARWCPDDLIEALSEQLENIKHEWRTVSIGSLVLDDDSDHE